MPTAPRQQYRTYDHRLRELVRETGDLRIASDLGVPRSTARSWLTGDQKAVVTLDVMDTRTLELQREVLTLRRART